MIAGEDTVNQVYELKWAAIRVFKGAGLELQKCKSGTPMYQNWKQISRKKRKDENTFCRHFVCTVTLICHESFLRSIFSPYLKFQQLLPEIWILSKTRLDNCFVSILNSSKSDSSCVLERERKKVNGDLLVARNTLFPFHHLLWALQSFRWTTRFQPIKNYFIERVWSQILERSSRSCLYLLYYYYYYQSFKTVTSIYVSGILDKWRNGS